jgi:hypothetical protein
MGAAGLYDSEVWRSEDGRSLASQVQWRSFSAACDWGAVRAQTYALHQGTINRSPIKERLYRGVVYIIRSRRAESVRNIDGLFLAKYPKSKFKVGVRLMLMFCPAL